MWKVAKEVGVIVETASVRVGWWEREVCGGCGWGLGVASEEDEEEEEVVVCCSQGRDGSAGA